MNDKMEVDLGVAFQPFAFLSAIAKNFIDFFVPGPTIFASKIPQVTTPVSTITNMLAQPSLDLKIRPPDITLFETTLIKPTTITFEELMPTFPSAISAPVATTGNIFTTVWDALKGPTETFLDFFLTKGKLEAATSIAQSQADTQRATQAVVEAQERATAAQIQQQKEAQGILSTEAWKKAAPYAIPIAAGLAIVALLLVVKKGDKKKK